MEHQIHVVSTATAASPIDSHRQVTARHQLIHTEISRTDHLYRSTTSLCGLGFLVTEIESAVSFQCCGTFYKSTTSLNGPDEFTPMSDRLREVLLYYIFNLFMFMYVNIPSIIFVMETSENFYDA